MITPLEWTPTPGARRAIVLVGAAIAAAFWFDHPALIGVAAAPLILLLLRSARARPSIAEITVEHQERCFEGEPVHVRVTVRLNRSADLVEATLDSAPGSPRRRPPASTMRMTNVDALSWTSTVVVRHWGSRPVGLVEIRLWDRHRLVSSRTWAWPQHELRVYPRPAPVRRLQLASTRFDRAGDHSAPAEGGGVEFASVRPFVGTDRPHQINWPVSTRLGALYVTARRPERAVDVVVAVDLLADVGATGDSSRDLALSGATGVVRAVLRQHDRVGLVAVGGRLQWLKPEPAERQFYRIVDTLLAVSDWFSYLDPDVDRIPYPAFPPGATVIFFSPLVDPRGIAAAHRLRARGHPVTVVDICHSEPHPTDPIERLALRLWRLERLAIHRRLQAEDIRVVPWNEEIPLESVVRDRGRPGGARWRGTGSAARGRWTG